MDKISIVTAFFDIGRKNFKGIPRTNNVYLGYFKFWARLRNDIVIYTESSMQNEILNIRKEFGLENRTKIVIIDDIEEIEPDILKQMESIYNGYWFKRFRIIPNATSNIPRYSYLMFLKVWFIKDAVEKGLVNGQVAWVDFGFNHGGKLYIYPEDFDFEWQYPFSDKIHLFYRKKLDQKPIYEIVRRLSDCIMGAPFVLPSHYAPTFYKRIKQSINLLLLMGLYDDDQSLLLMAYRSEPEIFEMHLSDWFLPLKEYGGKHLRIRPNNPCPWYKKTIFLVKKKVKEVKLAVRYSFITFLDLIFEE